MNIVKAKLIKHTIDDTPIGVKEDIPLGTIYYLDMNSKRNQLFGDVHYPGKQWDLETVHATRYFKEGNPECASGLLPLDLFEII